MSASRAIFIVNADNQLSMMRPSAPPNEDALQKLVEDFPHTISFDEVGELLLVRREQPVADSESGSGRWSLDHLFVTREAVPVLVEVKRWTDHRLRREVVAQMLDYAANASTSWTEETVEHAFRETCRRIGKDPEDRLREFLGEDGDADGFWRRVKDNLGAGNLKLLFVADRIPSELARIVEFLNEQMRADVFAVELGYFEGDGGIRTLVPRIIGATERAMAKKGRPPADPISASEWLQAHIISKGEAFSQGLDALKKLMEEIGAEFVVPERKRDYLSIVIEQDTKKVLKPFSLGRRGQVSINFPYYLALSEQERLSFLNRYSAAVGPLSDDAANSFVSFPLDRLAEPNRAESFIAVACDWVHAIRDVR